jgi:hypothetical protein
MVVVCRRCDARPDTRARLIEIVREDWRPTAEEGLS